MNYFTELMSSWSWSCEIMYQALPIFCMTKSWAQSGSKTNSCFIVQRVIPPSQRLAKVLVCIHITISSDSLPIASIRLSYFFDFTCCAIIVNA